MDLFSKVYSFDFMGKRKPFMWLSLALIVVSFASFVLRGFNFGIDFTGGILLEVGYKQPVELAGIRSALTEAGHGNAMVQHYGASRDVLVRLAPKEGVAGARMSEQAFAAMQRASGNTAELRRVEFVGPQVGRELAEDGGLAILYSLIGILIYVGLRFEYRLAIGAIIATMHDVIITVGVFSLLQLDFDLTVLASVLTVIGYSLNDTVVVYDRIRENFRKMRKGTVVEIINQSLNQTLSRTIMTGVTTLMTVGMLYIFGGESMGGFSLALLIGIVVGTYSSIYVASAAIILLGVSKTDMLLPVKEGAETTNTRVNSDRPVSG